jgi:hypothetical protein
MNGPLRTAMVLFACAALPACSVKLHGHESAGSGGSSTTLSSTVSASARASNARVSVLSGSPVAPDAPGGHLRLSGHAVGWLVAGGALAGLFNAMTRAHAEPLPADRPIAHTCSCYGYNPSGSAPAQARSQE